MADQADDGALFGLDGTVDPAPAPRRERAPWTRRRAAVVAAGVAVVLATGAAVAVAASRVAPTVPVAATTSAEPGTATPPAATTARASAAPKIIQPTPTISPQQLAAEKAELQRTAALLRSPIRLTSPASWDPWLPQGKSPQDYQRESAEEDMATCPHLAAQLSEALGQPMSYWIGTLPMGPNGCDWADEPLTYDTPAQYAYVLSIGFVEDGSTTEGWRHHFYEHAGAICPDIDVPAVGPGVVLVRCADAGQSEGYTLVLPDTRTSGVWFVGVDVRPNASKPASYVFTTMVDAVAGAFG